MRSVGHLINHLSSKLDETEKGYKVPKILALDNSLICTYSTGEKTKTYVLTITDISDVVQTLTTKENQTNE